MAVKLNLLPPEYTTTKGLGSLLKATRALGIISIAVFIVFTLGVSAFFVISTLTLKNLNSDLDSLKGQISSQEKSEQQIVLLKDRLSKIKSIIGTEDASNVLSDVNPYVTGLPTDSTLGELDLDSLSADFSVTFRSNSNLSAFMSQISQVKEFQNVRLTSFAYNPESGYTIGVSLERK